MRSPTLLSFPLALSFLVGCGPPPPQDDVIDIVFDPCEPLVIDAPDVTDPQREGLVSSIELWNELLGSQLSLEGDEHAPRIPLVFEKAALAFHGYYDDEEGIVYINDRLEGRDQIITVAHELGHTFGLFHVEESVRPSVMNHGNLEHAPNDDDAHAVHEIWGACSDDDAP